MSVPGAKGAGLTNTRPRPANCPERAPAARELPNTFPELSQLDYWLSRSTPEQLDEPLLSPGAAKSHDVALRTSAEGAPRSVDLTRTLSSDELATELTARFAAFAPRFESGELVAVSEPAEHAAQLKIDPKQNFREARSLVVALSPVELHCLPFTTKVVSTTGNPRFDRNRCSHARAQEPIEVLGQYGSKLRVARTRYAWGFITDDAALSAPVPANLVDTYRRAEHELTLVSPLTHGGKTLPVGTLLPAASNEVRSAKEAAADQEAWLADKQGFERTKLASAQAQPTARPLTRRAFLTDAFQYVNSPYGWGDENGGRDCSRLVLDVLTQFGLHVPRTSGEQGAAGLYTVDVPADANETERLGLLEAANARGLVLIHLPGHIMVYLGRDHLGTPRVLHSFAEYLAPCPEGNETLFEVGRVGVTDLSLGKGTSRRSFLERFTRLTVFGRPPDHTLLALSKFRRPLPPSNLQVPEDCHDSVDIALFRSPREPHAGAPLRVIAATQNDTRPAGLWLIDPKGQLVSPEVHELGVGPYARFVEVDAPTPGRWTALLSDGDRTLACERIRVADKAPASTPRAAGAPAWPSKVAWERDTENLYSAFVEQLFSQPLADLGSWPSLTPLLADRTSNLLFDHLGKQEDSRLKLAPDCADLPYFLRGYFAWKLGLPFGYRPCSRGRAGVAPRCGDLVSNALPIEAEDDVKAFDMFVRQRVGSGVHSASARTLPTDEATDLYPLPFSREAIKPGSVFADPYGHTIVVAKWVPQGWHGAGMLIGADAQPDATVARRRFWRGNFLFTPDTRDVGAGFKAFRPLVENHETDTIEALGATALASNGNFPLPALAQYEGSQDDFYARMDELIYPRAVGLADRLEQLVSALSEQVERRVEAIDVGEQGIGPGMRPVTMPEGYAVFETTGAWEDFATPSRDMRLLIAIDAVRALPGDVAKRPERYGIDPAQREQARLDLETKLSGALGARRFAYTRSDGSRFELSLSDVVARSEALELAYNPNDCPELRWAAPASSDELATCKRHAPAEQRTRMERYRAWFHDRARPPR
ncbi:MAG: NlpC/P60 family protein [Myxococcales bacterium]